MRILLVEDNHLDADLAVRSLKEHQVTTATTLADAWRQLLEAATPYHVVLLDMYLPDGTGANLITRIRMHRLPTAIVILSGNRDLGVTLEALRLGADDYILKDFGAFEGLSRIVTTARGRFLSEAHRAQVPLQVLYAEHNPADIDLLQRHLTHHAPHITLLPAKDAQQALATIQRLDADRIQVILLDLRLPGMDGIALLKTLRQEQGITIPILVCTGVDQDAYAVQALRLGATAWIVKHPNYLPGLVHQLVTAHYQYLLQTQNQETQRSLTQYQSLLEHSQEPIFVCDHQGHITLDNLPLRRLMGMTKNLRGRNVLDLVVPGDRPGLASVMERILREHCHGTLVMRMPVTGEEQPRRFEWRLQVVHDADGRFITLQVFCRDLSDYLPRVAEVLAVSQVPLERLDARDQLHDLNNLMTISLGNLERLRRQLGERSPHLDTLGLVEQANLRTVELLRGLRGIHHTDQEKVCDLGQVLGELGRLSQGALPPRVQLRIAPVETAMAIPMTSDDLLRVLLNLVINARDALPAGGSIAISTTPVLLPATPGVEIQVVDDGIGIPADLLPRILEQGLTTKAPGKGSGVGLPSCHRIVRAAGGDLTLSSTPGQGTLIRLRLPLHGSAIVTRAPLPTS